MLDSISLCVCFEIAGATKFNPPELPAATANQIQRYNPASAHGGEPAQQAPTPLINKRLGRRKPHAHGRPAPNYSCSAEAACLAMISANRSLGSSGTRNPSTPVIVSAATIAFTTASSVASTTAMNSGLNRLLGCIVKPLDGLFSSSKPVLAVEKAMNMSPDPSLATAPRRPRPSEGRFAKRFSWCGSNGASVATTTMIDPFVAVFRRFLIAIANAM